MLRIRTDIEIDASAERVWEVLTDFGKWDSWNPLIPNIRTRPIVGADVDFHIRVGTRFVPIRARMLRVEPNRELCWRGPRNPAQGRLMSGEHFFRVEPLNGERSRFVHGEDFTGPVPAVLAFRLRPMLERAYAAFNRALKERSERAA